MNGQDSSSDEHVRRLPRWVRAADYLVFGLLGLTIFIVLFGGIHVEVWGVRARVTSPFRLLQEVAVVALLRTWRYRRPSIKAHFLLLTDKARARLAHRWMRVAVPCAAIFVATRIAVLIIGYVAVIGIGYPADAPPQWLASSDELRNLPARWDSGWYLGIAMHGYQWNPDNLGQQNIIFFPAFPFLMRCMALLIWHTAADPAPTLWAGVFVSLIAFAGALVYLFRLAQHLVGEENAAVAALMLSAYPFALFYGAAYTESLYLLAAVAAFFHFLRGQVAWAMGWGLVAGLTRPNGWMIGISLAILVLPTIGILAPVTRWMSRFGLSQPPESTAVRRQVWLLAAAATPALGLLLYSTYIYTLTGHPFMWARLMTYWDRDFNGWSIIQNDFAELGRYGTILFIRQSPSTALNALAFVFSVISIWPVSRRLGLAYGVFVLVNIALPAASGGLVSIGRYSSVLFPSFIWLAMATPRDLRAPLIALFALFQAVAAALFFTWRPIF